MKKIIFSMLALSLIALCFSMSLHAQSSEKDLDQVELMKQFIGTWTAVLGEDTTQIWEVIPMGKGYEHVIYWQAKGETYDTGKGITGFTPSYVNMFWLWSNGNVRRDYGKFESDKKIIFEGFNITHTHVSATYDWHLITPDKIKMIFKSRGSSETWDDAVVTEFTYIRLKK